MTPNPNPRRVGAMLAEALAKAKNRDPLQWAKDLRDIEQKRGGELPAVYCGGRQIAPKRAMTPFQRQAWRDAQAARFGEVIDA